MALDHFRTDVQNAVCLDLGAAAGGFTTVLLRRGARLAYALDVGVGQLRVHPRVVHLERTNLADASRVVLCEPRIDLVTVNPSYLSLADALPRLDALWLAPTAQLIALVKPTFELGRERPPVDDASVLAAVDAARRGAIAAGWVSVHSFASPIRGAKGSREFFIHAGPGLLNDVAPSHIKKVASILWTLATLTDPEGPPLPEVPGTALRIA